MLEAVAAESSGSRRLVLGNLWLTWPLVKHGMTRDPKLDAMIRTTTALTLFNSGVKENVVPQVARASLNFRILPGDTAEDVTAHIREVIADPEIEIALDAWAPAAPPSRTSSPGYALLAASVREVLPDAAVLPGLISAATDSRHFADLAQDVYRFIPARVSMDSIDGVHGTDERIPVAGLADTVRISVEILRRAAY